MTQGARIQFQLQDIVAFVVGCGMAALLFRAFWPSARPSVALAVPAVGLYFWLGLAISGPIILLRQGPRGQDSSAPGHDRARIPARTWAELAWLLIGIYWIVLGLFTIPARLHEFKTGDMVVFGLVPIVVALVSRLFGPRPALGRPTSPRWTHTAAVVLLLTWPAAWLCLIVLAWALL